jgi:hypothetical protein
MMSTSGLVKARRITRTRLSILQFGEFGGEMRSLVAWQFGHCKININWLFLGSRGYQPDLTGPGHTRRLRYAAQVTKATHRYNPKQTS